MSYKMKGAVVCLLILPFLAFGYELCKGPQRGQEFFMAEKEFLCAIKCKKSDYCSSYLYKDYQDFQDAEPNNEFDGNCVLRNKYEDYMLSELQDIGDGYVAKLGLVVDNEGTVHFHKVPTNYNVTHEAIQAGFTLPMDISSTKVTKYVMHQDFPPPTFNPNNNNNIYKQVCPLLGGIQVHEYDLEVTAALNAIGGLTPIRPMALILQPTDTGVITLWDNGMQDYSKDLLAANCPKYSWTDNHWLDYTDFNDGMIHTDTTTGVLIKGQMNPIASKVSCQFVAPNLALNKPAGSLHVKASFPPHLGVDGDYHLFMHGGGGGTQMEYFYINLLDTYAIKMITLATRDCCAPRNMQMDFWVGDEKPTTDPLDETHYRLCTHYEHQQRILDVHGFTCDKITVGKFVVIKNRASVAAILINEVTVHGWPISIFE